MALSDEQAEKMIGPPPAVCLLSGGLDSTTALAFAIKRGFDVHALSFSYNQRHRYELDCAEYIAKHVYKIPHTLITLGTFAYAAVSALTDLNMPLPKGRDPKDMGADIPVSYVPARNILFLTYAAGYAEMIGANDIFCGVNALDYSGYPDCRPEFIAAFEVALNTGTKSGVEGRPFTIHTPLIDLSKKEIIQMGLDMGVDYSQTHSCYDPKPGGKPCGECDSCVLRITAFNELGIPDPTMI